MRPLELDWTLSEMIQDAGLQLMTCHYTKVSLWMDYIKALEDLRRAAHTKPATFQFYADQLAAASDALGLYKV